MTSSHYRHPMDMYGMYDDELNRKIYEGLREIRMSGHRGMRYRILHRGEIIDLDEYGVTSRSPDHHAYPMYYGEAQPITAQQAAMMQQSQCLKVDQNWYDAANQYQVRVSEPQKPKEKKVDRSIKYKKLFWHRLMQKGERVF